MTKSKVDDCPLKLHRNGQWYRVIKKKFHYFGKDKDQALEAWAQDKDDLLAGRVPRRHDSRPPITELGNLFIARCRRRVEEDDMERRTADEYENTVGRFIALVGADRRVDDIRPLDYAEVKDKFAESLGPGTRTVKRRAPTSVAGDVRRVRAFLNWCYDSELIEAPPRFGKEFSVPSRKVMRRRRAEIGRRDFSPESIHAILSRCEKPMTAIIMLGINAAMGAKDIAAIQLDDLPELNTKGVFFDCPRGKTGAPRRIWLWPETIAAIKKYRIARPTPRRRDSQNLLFVTRIGQAWHRQEGTKKADAIANSFQQARKRAAIDQGSFYDLRRTFQTIGNETLDRQAVMYCMGHIPDANDMGSLYTQHIEDKRIKKVCQHVRSWLFGEVT